MKVLSHLNTDMTRCIVFMQEEIPCAPKVWPLSPDGFMDSSEDGNVEIRVHSLITMQQFHEDQSTCNKKRHNMHFCCDLDLSAFVCLFCPFVSYCMSACLVSGSI